MSWIPYYRREEAVPGSFSAVDPPLTPAEKAELLRAARQALLEHLRGGEPSVPATRAAALRRFRSTFVTLRRRDTGELRGCRGDCSARHTLVESVMRMAIASGTDDARFPPVTPEEAPSLTIEISALGEFFPIRVEAIEIGRHGLMIVKGRRLGLLLPQVPVAYGWGPEEYLRALCGKAGLPDGAWTDPTVRLFGFETECWSEHSVGSTGAA